MAVIAGVWVVASHLSAMGNWQVPLFIIQQHARFKIAPVSAAQLGPGSSLMRKAAFPHNPGEAHYLANEDIAEPSGGSGERSQALIARVPCAEEVTHSSFQPECSLSCSRAVAQSEACSWGVSPAGLWPAVSSAVECRQRQGLGGGLLAPRHHKYIDI